MVHISQTLHRCLNHRLMPCTLQYVPVASKALLRDLEFTSTITERHESENPEQETNGLSTDILDSTDIDRLAVITQPIAKVDPLDARGKVGQRRCLKKEGRSLTLASRICPR